jgi:hypothetical protein
MRAFLYIRLALSGTGVHRQARFFYGMANGIVYHDAMLKA